MSQNYNNSHTWANLLSIPPPPFIKFAARPPFYLVSHSDATYISHRIIIVLQFFCLTLRMATLSKILIMCVGILLPLYYPIAIAMPVCLWRKGGEI